MPRYDYKCKCGEIREEVHPIVGHPQEVPCACGAKMTRYFPAGMSFYLTVDNLDKQYDWGAGRTFSNRSERKQWMSERGVHEVEPNSKDRDRRSMDQEKGRACAY